MTARRSLTVRTLFEALVTGHPPPFRGLDRPISQVTIDSREATPDSLFVALKGEHEDGHTFIRDALERGASAVIAEPMAQQLGLPAATFISGEPPETEQAEPPYIFIVPDSLAGFQEVAAYWRRQLPHIRVVGVTGSVGKTSVKEQVTSVLKQRFHTLKSAGNYNNEIGLPWSLLQLTPEHERAVLEMGMYAIGEIRHLANLALPHTGVVTNIGPTHLERLGSLEAITDAKAELVEALPPQGTAILNGDDPRVRSLAERTEAQVFTYGLSPTCDLWADQIESRGIEGLRFQFHTASEDIFAVVPLLGQHSVHTALAAASVGLIEGEGWDEIIGGLKDISAKVRLVTVPGIHGSIILDDTYNASPASTLAALNLLADLPGRRIAVLGDMYELGSYEQAGHELVGTRTADVADLLVTVGKLGRLIGEAALAAGMKDQQVQAFATKQEAIHLLRTLLQERDILLVKGSRGLQMEEIVAALSSSVSS